MSSNNPLSLKQKLCNSISSSRLDQKIKSLKLKYLIESEIIFSKEVIKNGENFGIVE